MTRKIDINKKVRPTEIDDVSKRKEAARPPSDWPGIAGRSEEDEAEFVHDGEEEAPAQVTEAQRDLERSVHHRREPDENK